MDYVVVVDQKASGSNGGTFTAGDWQTRDLNTEQVDTAGIASVAANRVTLLAGSYWVRCVVPSFTGGQVKARLYDVTGAAVLLESSNGYSGNGTCVVENVGRITLAVGSALEVQHQCETTTGADGLGVACAMGNEIYTIAEFLRE